MLNPREARFLKGGRPYVIDRFSVVIKMAAPSVSSSFSHEESDDEESSVDDSSLYPDKLDPSNSVIVNVKTRKIAASSLKGSGRENRLGSLSSAFPSSAAVVEYV